MGRLTMLRHVVLNLDSEYPMSRRSNGQRFPPDRDRIWREWTMHVFSQEKDAYFRYSGREDIEFPALEKLKLDFTEWQLANNEGLLVSTSALKLTHIINDSLGETICNKIGGTWEVAGGCTEGREACSHCRGVSLWSGKGGRHIRGRGLNRFFWNIDPR